MLVDKYDMTVFQNIDLAKRLLVDSIWKSTVFEGFAVTFPETSEVVEGRVASQMSVDAVLTINNLKRAWAFLLENIDYPLDLKFITQINRIVGGNNLIRKAGVLRVIGEEVRIGGTSWKPTIPSEDELKERVNALLSQDISTTEKALRLMAYLMRTQAFLDGNKRTAMLVENHLLIQNGDGLLQIEIENGLNFKRNLIEYYETNEIEKFISYVYDTCLYGEMNENLRTYQKDYEWER